jgi:hypothetical protein
MTERHGDAARMDFWLLRAPLLPFARDVGAAKNDAATRYQNIPANIDECFRSSLRAGGC